MNVSIASKISNNNLVFRLRAATPEGERVERSLHIGILLDNSGSMEGERLAAVKRTLHAARPLLRLGDRLTLVTFSDSAAVCLREHILSDETAINAAYEQIDQIRAETSTNLSVGLEALYGITTDYDAVILLTDGIVNAGITSTVGLRTMAQAVGGTTLAFHTIGYGAVHNRTLLRELSVQSRATYTYADSDEILALAVGDILSGLRAEVARGVHLHLSAGGAGWRCLEAGAQETPQEYYVGHMVADRDYWAVFQQTGEGGAAASGAGVLTATVSAVGQESLTIRVIEEDTTLTEEDVTDQVMRAQVAAALLTASAQLETSGTPDMTELRALQTRLEALPPRPLLVRLRAQVAELLEMAGRLPTVTRSTRTLQRAAGLSPIQPYASLSQDVRTHLMARMSSGATCLANQRGVYSMASTEEGDPDITQTSFFSSPIQHTASNVVRAGTHIPQRATTPVVEAEEEEDTDAPAEPIGLSPPSLSDPSVPATQMEEID